MAKVPLRREEVDLIRSASERVAKRMNGRYELDLSRVQIVENEVEKGEANDNDLDDDQIEA